MKLYFIMRKKKVLAFDLFIQFFYDLVDLGV